MGRFSTKNILLVLAGIALVLPVCISLLTSYVPDGHDTLEYLTRQVEFDQSIRQGILFPQWAPDLVRGAGEPLFEFNPPMIYFAAEFWHLLGCNFVLAINLGCVTLVVAAAIAMFLLARLYFGDWGGWLAAAAYLYAPYMAVNLYVRGALAELAAFPFYALTMYGFGAYAKRRRTEYLLLGAVAYAGISFSHNAAALFFTPLLLAFFVVSAQSEKSWSVLWNQFLGWMLGLGLGACVWLPSLAERKYVRLDRLLEGYLRYTNHFVYPHQLIYSAWGYGKSIPGDQDTLSLSLGWSHLLLVVLVFALASGYRKKANWRWLWFFSAAAAVFCFLMTPAAEWIWDRLPLLQYVEFPWRMLGPASFCVAMLIGGLGTLLREVPRASCVAFAAALVLLIFPNVRHNRPERYRAEMLSEWAPKRLSLRGVEATTAFEYVPRWVEAWPNYNPGGVRVVHGDAQADVTSRKVSSWVGNVRAAQPSVLELYVTWFPGWVVTVDDNPVSAGPTELTGIIRFEVPAGVHRVEATWKRTWPRLAGQTISWLSFVTLVVAGVLSKRRVHLSGS